MLSACQMLVKMNGPSCFQDEKTHHFYLRPREKMTETRQEPKSHGSYPGTCFTILLVSLEGWRLGYGNLVQAGIAHQSYWNAGPQLPLEKACMYQTYPQERLRNDEWP